MDRVIDQNINDFFNKYPLRSFKKGQILIYKDDEPNGVFRLESGRVRQYDITNNGDEVVVNMHRPPTFFPMTWALNGAGNQFFFEAATDVQVRIAPKIDMINFLRNNSSVVLYLLGKLYAGIDDFSKHKFYMMKGSAHSRTVMELIMCCKRYTNGATDPYCTLQFTEGELATMSGLTRETINREIKKLQKKGILDIKNRTIVVNDRSALEDELELAL